MGDVTSGQAEQSLRDRGILSCEILDLAETSKTSEFPEIIDASCAPLASRTAGSTRSTPAPDDPAERLIRTTTGKSVLVSVPEGLRSPCFALALPQQRALASIVMRDIEDLALRVGQGNPAKGIGIAANQSASLVSMMKRTAAGTGPLAASLSPSQRQAAAEDGRVPAFFRYRDPRDNVVRVFNPRSPAPSESGGQDAGATEVRPEGCLSAIELRGQVARPVVLTVDGEDLEGRPFRITARGPAARLIGHELSHVNRGIDGLCIIEGGLPVLPLDEYSKLKASIREWSFPMDFTTAPSLELSDPAGELDTGRLEERLIQQGLFTPTPNRVAQAGR